MRRWLWVLLAASLIGNAFFVGLDGFVAYRLHQGGLTVLERFTGRGLAADDRAILNSSFEQDRAALLQALAKASAAHRASDQVLRAVPFDATAYRAALDNWQNAFSAFLGSFKDPMVRSAAEMSQAGRNALAARGDDISRRADSALAGR